MIEKEHKYAKWIGKHPVDVPVNKLMVLVNPQQDNPDHVHLDEDLYDGLEDYLPDPDNPGVKYVVTRIGGRYRGNKEFLRMVLGGGEWSKDFKEDVDGLRFEYSGNDTSRLVADLTLERTIGRWQVSKPMEIFRVESLGLFSAKLMFRDLEPDKARNIGDIGAFWCWPDG